jgi:CheY-like chemotaxis protein
MYKKILCVDDDPITLMLSKKVLQKIEFSEIIDSVQNGEDALNYLSNCKVALDNDQNFILPEFIFLDLNMPIMGGWEFLDEIMENKYGEYFPDLKVIVLSSTIDPKDIEKSKSYPMVLDFLSKPICRELLEGLKRT